MATTIVPTAKATSQKKQGRDPMKEKLLQWSKLYITEINF
jgi:hypothetical protein